MSSGPISRALSPKVSQLRSLPPAPHCLPRRSHGCRATVVARTALLGCALLQPVACSHASVPDPRAAVQRYAEAAERGDAEALYAMLTREGQRTHGPEGVQRLTAGARKELSARGRVFSQGRDLDVRTAAELRYHDGETARVPLEDGAFKVSAAGGLPAAAQTPAEALVELRQALSRRSYAGLLRALSPETRSELEHDISSLVTGLERPEALEVRVDGDAAEVQVPGGHWVKLKREAGVWKVEDFD